MASESETRATETQSVLERLISSRNRDLSLFLPFLLGFTGLNPARSDSDDEAHRGDRIILISPLTQGMVVIEGEGLDSLLRDIQNGKGGQPPASKSSVEAMPRVEIREGDEGGECAICLEEFVVGSENGVVKEMPCQHRFHGECIEKWLGIHGSCPVCRFKMPVEEEKKGEEREEGRRRVNTEVWVSFSFGRRRGDQEEESESGGGDDQSGSDLGYDQTAEN